jgi:hypothetical protein
MCTGILAHGKSAKVRQYWLCTLALECWHSGQAAVGAVDAITKVMDDLSSDIMMS